MFHGEKISDMKNNEDLFIERINQKQRGAFHELFGKFYRSLVMYAMKYVGEQGEAEDIVQDLFVAIWEKQEKFLSYHSFRVFLYNSVRNTCINAIKHRKVEEKYVHYRLSHFDESDDADFEMMREDIFRQLFQVIDQLPPRCREVFLLHMDGKKNEEIATQLRITLLTVKTQNKKAVHYIRKRMSSNFLFLFFCPFL